MKRLALLALTVLLIPGGCPNDGGDGGNSPAVARIGTSSTSGPAPLRVTFTAVDSSSSAGDIVRYAWNFGDGTTSDQISPTHDFTAPGRYTVKLDVEDSAGNVGTETVEIRAAGGPATAVLSATPISGRAPLSVRFDGRGSSAVDDTIADYRWDFDDGTFAQTPAPIHVFLQNGTYDVTLRVTTGGGVEATATQRITVGGVLGSLQFNGTQLANLPLPAAQNLSALTLETWFNADAEGGAALSVGTGALVIRIEPAGGRVVVQLRGTDYPASSANLSGTWRHLAVAFDAAAGGTIYLDGVAIGTFSATGNVGVSGVTAGFGFRGKLSEVRLWSVVRSAAEIAAARNQRVGATTNLLGGWPLNEGSGQSLRNVVSSSNSGTLGNSTAAESADPAWSTDGPPLP